MVKKSKSSIRKSTPANEWFRNAARSMGLAGSEIITSLTPATGEFLSENANFSKEVVDNLREARKNAKPISEILSVGPYVKMTKDAFKNAKEDLRSGNFWNTERGSDFDDDFELGDDFAFLDLDDSDTVEHDEEDGTTIVNKKTQVNVLSDTKPVIKALEGNARITVNAAEAIVSTTKHMGERTIAAQQQLGITTIKGLETMNENLSLLVNFQNDSMTKYIAASIKYYDESLTEIRKGIASLDRAYPVKSEEKDKSREEIDVFGTYGGLNLRNYMQQVKKNIKNSDNPFISTAQMMFSNDDFLQSIVDSPLRAITKATMNTLIPAVTKQAFEQFDQSFASFAPAMMMRFNKLRESDNPFYELIGNIFGVKTKGRTTIDPKSYNRGPVPWDGTSKRALEEVIPRHLSAIHSAITGQSERMFDYQEGIWSTVEDMQKRYDEAYTREATRGYSSVMSEMKDIINTFRIENTKEKEALLTGIDKFFAGMTKKDRQVDINKLDEIREIYDFGGDPNLSEFFQSILLNTSIGSRLEAVGMGQMQSRKNLTKFIDEIEKNPSMYNVGLLSSKAEFNKGMEKDPQGNLVAKKGFGISGIDQYGKGQLDYLRDILNTLQEGITVCDDCGGKKGRRNNTLSFRERLDARLKAEQEYEESHRPRIKEDKVLDTEQISKMFERGTVGVNSIIDIANGGSYDDAIKRALQNKKAIEASNQEVGTGRKFVNFVGSTLSGEAQQNYNDMVEKIDDLVNRPAKLLKGVFDKIDNTMYNLVFGIKDNGNTSFLATVMNKMQLMFQDIGDYAKDRIYKPISEFFLGQNGIWGKSKENPIVEATSKKVKEFFLGGKDENGEYHEGVFEGLKLGLRDTSDYLIHTVSGREYTDSKGVKHPKDENSVFGIIKSGAKTTMDETKKYILGDKDSTDPDKQKGSLSFIVDGVKESAEDWRYALFGPKDKSELSKEGSKSFAEMRGKIARGMPKAVVGGMAGGALASGLVSSMGAVGVLGSAILPGGPLGFALLGAALGMGTESNRFMEWAFGPQNDNGKRTGGALLKANQMEFLRRNKRAMIGGATVGAASNLLGFGILPAFIGPAGPLGAAVLGAATGIALRSEKAQEFLFGPKNADGKRVGGIIHKTFGKFNKGLKDENSLGRRKFFNTALGAAGGMGIGQLVATTGLLGSLFSPAAPIGLAVAGAAAGISLTSEKWRKFVFGEWDDKEGVKKGGIAQKFSNWSQLHIFDPLKFKVEDTISDMNFWFKDTIVESLKYGLSPIKDAAKHAGGDLVRGFKYVSGEVKDLIMVPFREHIAKPTGKVLSATLITPAKFVMEKTFDLQKTVFKTIFGIPAKLIEGMGMVGDAALMARGLVVGGAKQVKEKNLMDMATGEGGWFSRIKNAASTFNPSNWNALAFGEEGAKDYPLRLATRKANYVANREQRRAERASIKEKRKDLRQRRRQGWANDHQSYDDDWNDISYIYNVSKSKSAFDRYVRKGIDGDQNFNERLFTTLGVTGNQLLELREDRDIRNITKGQQKDLANKIKRAKKLGLKGDDLLSALGVEKVRKTTEERASEATVKIADSMEVVKEALAEKTFDITNGDHQSKLTDVISNAIAKAMGTNATEKVKSSKKKKKKTTSTPTIEESSSIDEILNGSYESSEEIVEETKSGRTKKDRKGNRRRRREKLKLGEFLNANLNNGSMGISAFGRKPIMYRDELESSSVVDEQDNLRQGYMSKMGLSRPLGGDNSDWLSELINNKEGIAVRIVGDSTSGGTSNGPSREEKRESSVGDSGVRVADEYSRKGTSTMGLGTLLGGMLNIGKGLVGLVGRGRMGGRIGGFGFNGAVGSNPLASFLNAMSTVSRRVGPMLDAAYNTNSSARILGSGSYNSAAEASQDFKFVNDGTTEISQRHAYAKRRNVNEFLNRKSQEDSSKMDAKFKHANIDLLSQIAVNTRVIAELLGNQYDLQHGFYSWLRDWLEDFNPCCGGFNPPGGGDVPPIGPIVPPVTDDKPDKTPKDDDIPDDFMKYYKDKDFDIDDYLWWMLGAGGAATAGTLLAKKLLNRNKNKTKIPTTTDIDIRRMDLDSDYKKDNRKYNKNQLPEPESKRTGRGYTTGDTNTTKLPGGVTVAIPENTRTGKWIKTPDGQEVFVPDSKKDTKKSKPDVVDLEYTEVDDKKTKSSTPTVSNNQPEIVERERERVPANRNNQPVNTQRRTADETPKYSSKPTVVDVDFEESPLDKYLNRTPEQRYQDYMDNLAEMERSEHEKIKREAREKNMSYDEYKQKMDESRKKFEKKRTKAPKVSEKLEKKVDKVKSGSSIGGKIKDILKSEGGFFTPDALLGKAPKKKVAKGAVKSGAKNFVKSIPGMGLLASAAFGVMDGVQGWNNAAEITGKDPSEIKTSDKVGAAVSSGLVGAIPFGDMIDQSLFDGKVTEAIAKVTAKGAEIVSKATEGLTTIGDSMGNVWTGVKDSVNTAKDNIVQGATVAWEGTTTLIGAGWDTVKTSVTNKVEEIKSNASDKWQALKDGVSTKWDETKKNVDTKLNAIKSDATTKWENLKKGVSTKWDETKKTVTDKMTTIKNDATTKWESLKKDVSTKWDDVKKTVTDKVSGVKQAAETKLGDLKGKVETALGGVASAITNPISKVSGWISKKLSGLLPGGKGYGNGTGVDSFIQDQSKSFIKKVDNLPNNIASIKEKKNSFAVGGPSLTLDDLNKQLKEGKIPSDSNIRDGFYDAFMGSYGKGAQDVYYSQNDPRWSNVKLKGKSTMGTSGCGPTAASMVVTSLTGEKVLPTEVAEFAAKNGFVDENRGVSSNLFASFGETKGVNVSEVAPTQDTILENLAKGNKVILRGEGSNSYTDSGHYIVASGLTKDGKVKINDPLSKARSGTKSLTEIKGTTHAFVASTTGKGYDDKLIKVAYGRGDKIFSHPAPGSKVSSPFGMRNIGNGPEFHQGIDLAKSGTVPIQAAADGIVTAAGPQGSYGNRVIIRHDVNGKRMDTVYAHMRDGTITVKEGDPVKRGQTIGYMGSTGRSSGQHLHFEIHNGPYVGGTFPNAVDPAPYIIKNAVATPHPFGGKSTGSDSGSTFKRAADALKAKFNGLDLIPDEFKQYEHAFSVSLDNLLYGTKDAIGLFNENNSSSSTGDFSLPTVKGSTNAEKVWNFFKEKGFSNHAIAGILGNLHQESGVDPTKKQKNGPAKGLAQWEGGRWTKLVQKAESKGVSVWELPIQLQHLWAELNGEDPTTKSILDKRYGGLNALATSTDYKKATEIFQESFERAGKPMYANRYKYAKDYLELYGKGIGGPSLPLPIDSNGELITTDSMYEKLSTNTKNVGGPALVAKDISGFNETSEMNDSDLFIKRGPFTNGGGVQLSSIEDRYKNDEVERTIHERNVMEKPQEVREIVYAEGPGSGNAYTLEEKDVTKILEYLSAIADNTAAALNSDVVINNHSKAGGSKTNNQSETKSTQSVDNPAFAANKGNNMNNVDRVAYNRAVAITKGRRNQ